MDYLSTRGGPERLPFRQTVLTGLARDGGLFLPADIPDEIVLSETREQGLKRQVREFTAGNPEVVATLIRGWMKEDGK